MKVVLGNRHAIHSTDHGETFEEMPRGKRATTIEVPEEVSMASAFVSITHAEGVWAKHAKEGATPAWVASDSPGLAALLSEHFGGIEVRELEADEEGDPAEESATSTRRSRGGGGASAAAQASATMLTLMLAAPLLAGAFLRMQGFLKTNAGNDFVAKQLAGSTASATAVAKWVAITANATAPAAGDTTLTGEITTAGGGLVRQVGVYAHTTGAASYTLTSTFTANASDSLPVTIAKRGVFDATSAGNLVFETLLPTTATLSAIGDSLTITDTVSI